MMEKSKSGLKQNLSDEEYREYKKIWQDLAKLYMGENFGKKDSCDCDAHHNAFIEVMEEIVHMYEEDVQASIYEEPIISYDLDWISLYNKLKMFNKEQI
jgi:hypothetical protein